MKISELSAEDFRGKYFTVRPQTVNTFFAPNGAGKTTMQDALRYAITGYLPKNFEGSPSVVCELESGITFRRGKACYIGSKKVSAKVLNETLESEFGTSLENIKTTSASEVLLAKKPEEFLGILKEHIPEDLDLNKIKGYFSDLDAEKEKILDSQFPAMPATFNLDKVDAVAEELGGKKKILNAELTQKKKIFESLKNIPAPVRDISEIEKALAEATVLSSDTDKAERLIREYEESVRRAEEQKQEIENLRTTADAIKAVPVSDEQKAKIQDQLDRAQRICVDSAKDLATVDKTIAFFKEQLENLDKPICPISKKLVCTTDKTAIRTEIQNQQSGQEAMRQRILANIANANAQVDRLKAQRTQITEVEKELTTKKILLEKIDNLEKHPVAIPPKPAALTPGTDLTSLIGSLRTELDSARKHEEALALEKEIERLTEAYKRLSDVAKSLADKGEVKAAIISNYFGIFETCCNGRAMLFAPGYEIKFRAEGGAEPCLKTPANSDFVPLLELSSGERLIGALLIVDMLNQLNNTRLCFIDNVEALDEASLRALRSFIDEPQFQYAYDHIFIMGVDHENVVKAFDGENRLAI